MSFGRLVAADEAPTVREGVTGVPDSRVLAGGEPPVGIALLKKRDESTCPAPFVDCLARPPARALAPYLRGALDLPASRRL